MDKKKSIEFRGKSVILHSAVFSNLIPKLLAADTSIKAQDKLANMVLLKSQTISDSFRLVFANSAKGLTGQA